MVKRIVFIVLMALVGVGLFAYPAVSNFIFARNASTTASEYDDTIAKKEKSEIDKAFEEAKIYNENLEGDPVHDPFMANSGFMMADNYAEVLNANGDGTMGYITIPEINVKIPLYHGTSDSVLERGIGHLEGSSLPIGGESTHSVLTGHTGLANAKMFTDLVDLKEGDKFYLHILNQTLAYQVDQIKVVLPEDTLELRRVKNKDYCTLVTCTPYGINTHRLLLRGVRVPYVAEERPQVIAQVLDRFKDWDMLIGLAVGIAVMIIIIIIIIIRRKRKPKQIKPEFQLPTERSDNPWAMPIQTPGGKKRRRRRRNRSGYWWDENDDRG